MPQDCYHCGEHVPTPFKVTLTKDGEVKKETELCEGCVDDAQVIVQALQDLDIDPEGI